MKEAINSFIAVKSQLRLMEIIKALINTFDIYRMHAFAAFLSLLSIYTEPAVYKVMKREVRSEKNQEKRAGNVSSSALFPLSLSFPFCLSLFQKVSITFSRFPIASTIGI